MHGRFHENFRNLDELALGFSSSRGRYATFNGNAKHGSWQLRRDELVIYFGHGEISGPDNLKWMVFQQNPGTRLWIAVKDNDARDYTCVMAEIFGQARTLTEWIDTAASTPVTHSPQSPAMSEPAPEDPSAPAMGEPAPVTPEGPQ